MTNKKLTKEQIDDNYNVYMSYRNDLLKTKSANCLVMDIARGLLFLKINSFIAIIGLLLLLISSNIAKLDVEKTISSIDESYILNRNIGETKGKDY